MATEPRYTYDPVTQTYTRVDAPVVTPVRGLGPLYDAGGGSGTSSVGGPGVSMTSPGMAEMGVGFQNFGLGMQSIPSLTTQAIGAVSSAIGNSMMGSQVSPVAAPVAPQEAAIAPATMGLAAMNAQTAAQQNAQAQQAAVANTATSVAQDVADVADMTDAEAGAAVGAATDSGGGGGASGDAGVSGAASEASHSADGNNPGESGGDGGSGGGCFLTTAAVKHMGQKDNGEVLNTLRDFRDTYMKKDKEKNKDVQWYYTNAPRIMRALDARKDAEPVYKEMYNDYVVPAYKAIKAGKNAEAYAMYKKLVNFAKRESGIDNDRLTPKPKHYAEGGLTSARKTENMGRGNDTMLVHMTPNEVRGLQAIAMAHGGSLTINPRTGLVEAGFLDAILPTIAGVALSAAFPAAAPWMIGLGVGGGTALMTGSLEKGLMAGLGAFGGAGIGSALTAPAVTGTQAGLSQAAAQGLGVQGAATGAGSQASMLAAENAALGFTPAESMAQVANSANYAANAAIPANVLAPTAAQSAAINAQANLGGMQQGISNLIQGTPGAREGFMQAAGGPMGLASKAGAAAAPITSSMFSAEEPDTGKKPQEYIRPYSFDFKPSAETDPDFKFRTGKPGESTAEQRYFTPTFTGLGVYKAGTEPGPSFYGTPTQDQLRLYSGPKSTGLAMANGGVANFDDEPGHDDDSMAMGGLTAMAAGGLKDGAFVVPADVVSHLGNGSNDAGQKLLARGLGAKPIKGKGDGMSDSIPTTIEGKQPARVADGEAYIPPEVVKKVGAKRLYSMMDKIRHARTGTKRQAPEVDPRKFIPA